MTDPHDRSARTKTGPTDTPLAAIEEAIRNATGSRFAVHGSEPVGGGCIHDAITVTDGRLRYFVKSGPVAALPMFEAEADGLAAIAASGAFRTPEVVAAGRDDRHAFLVLEHLEIHPVRTPTEGERFAEALAALHRTEGKRFGWHRDNYLGRTPQSNASMDNWAAFFIRHRLQPQFELARSNGLDGALLRRGDRLMEHLPALFLEYRPRPSLLHGDLWHGNAGILPDGTPTVFDPAVHYGDYESDLAMAELFGGFPENLYAAYHRHHRPDPGLASRRLLYTLYHMLNHLNLFGRAYHGEVERRLARLEALLS